MSHKSGEDMVENQTENQYAKDVTVKDEVPTAYNIPIAPVTSGTKPQTIFIHKLYDMLEDEHISHLIWWNSNGESFCLLPGEEFSKVLAQYFKHTNIASFIRQLNMYGFHKVNDQGQSENGSDPNVAKWEFRHLANNFRKGDIESLKLIKRRSSKNVTHAREYSTLNRNPSTNEDETHESGKENEPLLYDKQEIRSQEEQQHYHQTLQLQQQDQIPQAPQMMQHHPIVPRDNILPANVLPPLSKLPNRYQKSNDGASEAKIQELTHSLATLRQDYYNLQSKLDLVCNEQKKSQFDLIQLIEIMQRQAASSDDKVKLDYEFMNFKQVLLNKFNNIQALISQHPSNSQPNISQQQPRPHYAHPTMTPQLFSNFNAYNHGPKNKSIDSNMEIDSNDKGPPANNPQVQSDLDSKLKGVIGKNGQPPLERFFERYSLPNTLLTPHTLHSPDMRSRSFHQYPFPIMNSESRNNNSTSPDAFGSTTNQGMPATSSSVNEQRPPISNPNANLHSSRLYLSNSSGSSSSITSTFANNTPLDGRPRPSPLPSVSELDKLIKQGNKLPFFSLLNNYEITKRKSFSDEESRKRKP